MQTSVNAKPSTDWPTGVLWDMDGVLVDTGPFHYTAWRCTLENYGISLDRELFRHAFGMNNLATLTHFLGRRPSPEVLAEISDAKEQLFRQSIQGQVTPLPGVIRWLQQLQSHAVRQAVASSAPWPNIDALLDTLALRSYFNAVVSGADMPGKPNPSVFLEAARQLHVMPEHCIVIEDSIAGIEAARRAGMKTIAVTTTHAADRLGQADVIVESLNDLPAEVFECLLASPG
ncbi:MAG: HAD family phosphatase [Anaerolineae bacterium]|nr:HAD family phosphatase [Anaerolineae bacterium]